MIHPNHLRIGNKVFWDKEKELYYTINMHDFSSLNVFDKIEPILITKELLKNNGFVETYKEWTNHNYHNICFQMAGNGDLYYTAGEGVQLSKNIKYVHELQNLVFSLTGLELFFNV
jgi:hypothetical protein